MRAIVVQHEPHEGPAQLGDALQRAGFTLEPRFRGVQPGDVDAELVVVLGGPMSVAAIPPLPYLVAERDLLAARLRRELPCLGICLGAQVLAAAAGAPVRRGEAGTELGAHSIHCTLAGRIDPVTGELGDGLVVAHWHEDTFAAVPGATLLATSARYEQQVFRLGDSYGLQCHVELDAAGFATWLELGERELRDAGIDVAAARATLPALAEAEPARLRLLERLAEHFAASARRVTTQPPRANLSCRPRSP